MLEKKLTSSQTAILLVLMAEAREISNPELKNLYGVTLVNPDLTTLNDLKLVESWKQGRAFAHVLTDSGWAYAAALFREGMEAPGVRPGGFLRRHSARSWRTCRAIWTGLKAASPTSSPARRTFSRRPSRPLPLRRLSRRLPPS